MKINCRPVHVAFRDIAGVGRPLTKYENRRKRSARLTSSSKPHEAEQIVAEILAGGEDRG